MHNSECDSNIHQKQNVKHCDYLKDFLNRHGSKQGDVDTDVITAANERHRKHFEHKWIQKRFH